MQDQEAPGQVSNDLLSVHLSTSGRPEGTKRKPLPLYSRTKGKAPARTGRSRDLPRRHATEEPPKTTFLTETYVDFLKRLPLKQRIRALEYYNTRLPVADENIKASPEDLTRLKKRKAEISDLIRKARVKLVERFITSMHELHSKFPTLILYPNEEVYDDILTANEEDYGDDLFYKAGKEEQNKLKEHLAIAPNPENNELMEYIAEDSGVPNTFRVLEGDDWKKSKFYTSEKQMYFAFEHPGYPRVWIHGNTQRKTRRSLSVEDPSNTLPKEIAIQDLVDFAERDENVNLTLTIYVDNKAPAAADTTSALMRQQKEAFEKVAGKYYGTSSSLNLHRTSSTMAPVWIIKIQ